MEGIVKISRITAQATATLTREEFTLTERLADEGKGEEKALGLLDQLIKKRVLWTPHWCYIYIADQRGGVHAVANSTTPPVLINYNS